MKRWRLCLQCWKNGLIRSLISGLLMGATSAALAQIKPVNTERANSPTVTLTVKTDVNEQTDALPASLLQTLTTTARAIANLTADQDVIEVSRLRQRALVATISTLHTQGYFSPEVDLKTETGENQNGEIWHFAINPGPRTHVSQVDLTFSGAIQASEFDARRAALKQGWRLPVNQPFVNSQWSDAKQRLLDAVRRRDFYLARLDTRATIHADQTRAVLLVNVDSGPRVRLGALKTEGLRRVPEKLIERIVAYTHGEAFEQDRLDDWQLGLNDTAFFQGAFVVLENDPSQWKTIRGKGQDEIHIPVVARVVEAPRRSLSASLGADSDNGLRAEGLFRQNVLFGQAVRSSTGAGLDKNRRRFFHDLHLVPTRRGYHDSVGVLANHSEISGVTNTRVGLGWKRQQTRTGTWAADERVDNRTDSRVEYETRSGVVLSHDNTRIKGADTYTVPTLVATWQWLRRDVNDKNDPREGWLLDVGLGLGATLDEREIFHRASLRSQIWWPINRGAGKPHDVLTLRGEVGKVWSRTGRLPEDFSYRAGGVRSLRGYKYQSVGLRQGSAVVGAPLLAVFGLEYTRYISDTFGVAVFVDAGDAAPSLNAVSLRWGYGLGTRLRTPAGAFGMDVAWGEQTRKLRLYFSLGLAF